MQRHPLRLISVLVVAALPVASCSRVLGPANEATPRGTLPAAFPRHFPLPPDATITTSVVDEAANWSEARLVWRTDLVSAAQFFQLRLVENGYLVERSEGDDDRWIIQFVSVELFGTVEIEAVADGVAILIGMNAG